MNQTISNEKKLNEIVLEFSNETGAAGEAVDKMFSFSCPYRVNSDGAAFLARPWGRTFWYSAMAEQPEMNSKSAKHYLRSYFNHNKIEGQISISHVEPIVYQKPQPALDNGDPLNAFVVKGILRIG